VSTPERKSYTSLTTLAARWAKKAPAIAIPRFVHRIVAPRQSSYNPPDNVAVITMGV
jgi:hypothetical protein